MGADSETHSLIFGGAWGVLWRRGERTGGVRGVKETMGKRPTESTICSTGLTETREPVWV